MIRIGMATAAVALLVAACDNRIEPNGPPSPEAELATALDAVCRAVTLGGQGKVDEAARVFQDRAHAFLHELGAKGAEAAPEPTARLLRSKLEAESALAAEGPADPALVQRLVDLHDATRELARELGMGDQPPCQGAVA